MTEQLPHSPARRIYTYSPSSAVGDRAAFRRAISRMTKWGYVVEADANALARHRRFAGTDDERVAAIHRAAQSMADITLPTRGGYGLTRLLAKLDYGLIADSVHRGTHWVGMSDFTALQCALLAQTGASSWFGPALCEGFGAPRPTRSSTRTDGDAIDPGMLRSFQDLLSGESRGMQWSMQAPLLWPASLGRNLPSDPLQIDDAILWGGNLAMLCALVGTPYFPRIDGGILFLEDVGEHPYRIERMCTQLLFAGVLERQRAILLGQFTGYRLFQNDRGFGLPTVLDWLQSKLSIPILTDLPCGHVPSKVLLPVGKTVRLYASRKKAAIFWDTPKTAPHTLP